MKNILNLTTATIAAIAFTATANAEATVADETKKLTNIAADELAAQDWSSAEAELLSSSFSPEEEVFAKLNMAYLYSITGRVEQAQTL